MPGNIQPLCWLFLTLAASMSITSPAYPWGTKGHEIVAATIADASTWPDKAGRRRIAVDPYHFMNFPKDANTYDQQRDCKLRNCIVEAIAWYVQVLKSPDAPRNEKRIALRFIAHLVGDIHQPLHAGFAEDRGGNSVDVRFNGRKENLHSLWTPHWLSWSRHSGRDSGTNPSGANKR